MAEACGLFRQEATDYRADRLQGSVNVAIPLSWTLIGGFVFAAFFGTFAVLSQVPYARAENVRGTISTTSGYTVVVPARPGVISSVSVRDGERVSAQQPLLVVGTDDIMASGSASQERLLDSLRRQQVQIDAQRQAALTGMSHERSRIDEEAAGLTAELRFLEQQVEAQNQLVLTAQESVRSVEPAARAGFVSARDIQARRDLVLSRQLQLAQLQQTRASKLAQRQRQTLERAQAETAAQTQVAQLEASRAELQQRMTTIEAGRGYVVVAPTAGVVTALTVHVGDRVGGEQSVMAIVPDDGSAEVELMIPTGSAGFIARGQRVEVAIDAYPRQRYGSLEAHVRTISTVPVRRSGAEEHSSEAVYLATATISPESFHAFEVQHPVRRGMAISASIITRSDTLLGWLLESFF